MIRGIFSLIAFAATVAILGVSPTLIFAETSAGSLDVRATYIKAVDAMSDLPQPEYVTYHLESTSNGLEIGLVETDGALWLSLRTGSSPQEWTLTHRTFDYRSELVDQGDGRRYLTQRSFFDPTWYGTYRALREGMFDSQDPAPPRPLPNGALPTPPPTIRTIAAVSVMGTGIYNVEDRGTAVCPNGDAGRALHVWSRTRNGLHQLSDVIVDLQSMRFCMMQFSLDDAFGFHGIMEEDYADVGGYWMQTGGLLDGTIRVFGISMHHGVWRYKLTDMQFPATLSPDMFAER